MTIRPNKWTRPAWLLVAMGMLSLSLLWVSAQPQMGGKGKNLGFSDYDSQNRISSQLFAKEAGPKGQLIEITGLKVELYGYDGGTKATNLIVNATNCLFDQKSKLATSDQAVQATSGDGKIKLNGVGFRFEQAHSKIIVSNRVMIEISRDIIVKKQGK
jgi:hypothetical protein